MARINGSSSKNGYLWYADITERIPDDYLTTNKTIVDYVIWIQNNGKRFSTNGWTKRTKINGSDVWAEDNDNITTTLVGYYEAVGIMRGSVEIEHNADGSKKIPVEAFIQKSSYGTYDPGYCYLYGEIDLTTIPRTSGVTATDGYINDSTRPVSIHIDTDTTAFRHTLKYTFGSLSGTIVDKYAYLDYGWTLPTSLYTQIPNDPSGVGTITCETWNGNTLIGTSYVNFTARVDESQNKPTVSLTVVDTNKTLPTGYTTQGLTGSAYKFIRSVSNAQVTVSANAKNSASISSYRTINNSKVYTSASFTIENIEDPKFDVSATDSRRFTGYQSGNPTSINMVNYVPLTVNPNIYRPEPTSGEVALSVSGNYFSGSFGKQNNSLTVRYRYKESSASWDGVTYKTITATIDSTNNKYSVSLSLGTTFDYQKSYDFEVVGTDKIQSIPKTYRVSEGIPMFAMFKDHLESFGNKLVDNGGNLFQPNSSTINIGSTIVLTHNDDYKDTYIGDNGGNIVFRPNGVYDSTGQVYVDMNGGLHVSDAVFLSNAKAFYINNVPALYHNSNNYETIISCNGGPVVFRPNGLFDTTGQGYVDASGNLYIASNIYAGAGALFGANIYAPNYYSSTNHALKAVFGGNVHVLTMQASPYLEVQTDSINGVTSFGVDVWASDKRLKNSITDTGIRALDIIKQIKHREFKYNHSNEFIKIGYVADELEEIDDTLIFKVGKDELKQPKESVIIPLLSKAIQEQQEYIEKLEERIAKLEKIVNNISTQS